MARILVIDDDLLVRTTIRMVLESYGHQVAEAENGKVGISTDADYNARLIITDIIMPEKEGIETIQHFRRVRPSVKIIAISGGGHLLQNTPLAAARLLGADCVLTKPLSNSELLEAVNSCLSESAD